MDYAKEYGRLHRLRENIFAGRSITPHVDVIRKLVKSHAPRTLLDYGCGKGFQYSIDKIHEHWGVMPTLYDIGFAPLSKRPVGPFDGVLCTDVLEHIDKQDLPDVLRDIFSFVDVDAERPPFVFFSITCRLAKKTLLDGRNVHLTVEGPGWWQKLLSEHKPRGCTLSVAYMGVRNEDH